MTRATTRPDRAPVPHREAAQTEASSAPRTTSSSVDASSAKSDGKASISDPGIEWEDPTPSVTVPSVDPGPPSLTGGLGPTASLSDPAI